MAKREIDNLSELTAAEKDQLKQEIDDAVTKGQESIDKSDTLSDVHYNWDNTLTTIEKLVEDGKKLDANKKELSRVKDDAKKELVTKGDQAKKEIDGLSNLTDKEKDKLKKEIDEVVKKGQEAIDQSETIDNVHQIKEDTIKEIDDIVKKAKDTKDGDDGKDGNNGDIGKDGQDGKGGKKDSNAMTPSQNKNNNVSDKGSLPETGEKERGMLSAFGALLLSIGAWGVFRKKNKMIKLKINLTSNHNDVRFIIF